MVHASNAHLHVDGLTADVLPESVDFLAESSDTWYVKTHSFIKLFD